MGKSRSIKFLQWEIFFKNTDVSIEVQGYKVVIIKEHD